MSDSGEDVDIWSDVQLMPTQEVEVQRLLQQYRDEDRMRLRVGLLIVAIATSFAIWAILF